MVEATGAPNVDAALLQIGIVIAVIDIGIKLGIGYIFKIGFYIQVIQGGISDNLGNFFSQSPSNFPTQ